jgi:hypothetical protein
LPYLWVLATPFLLFALGAACNISAKRANDDLMPVHGHCWMIPSFDSTHSCETPETRLKLLDDRIEIEPIGIYSIGDVFLWLREEFGFVLIALWLGLLVNKRGLAT